MPRVANVDSDILDTLRLSPRDAEGLLDKLQARSEMVVGSEKRRAPRVFFTQISGLQAQVIHPGGSTQSFLVLPTDISAGGMCVLHGGYLHAGSQVRLWVPDRKGHTRQVEGRTVRCSYFQAMIHEVGVMFDEPIRVSEFTEADQDTNQEQARPKLLGQLLYVEDAPDYRELMRFHLLDMGVQVVVSALGGDAVRMVQDIEFDGLIVDGSLPDMDSLEVIRQARGSGFDKPIFLAVAEQTPELAEAAALAGATQLMIKPTPRDTLYEQLAGVLSVGPDTASMRDVIYSEHWSDQRMRPLITAFLGRLESLTEPLANPPALFDTRRDMWKVQAQDVRTSAAGYGLHIIAEAAGELTRIDPGDQALYQQSYLHLQQLVQRALLVIAPKGKA